MIQIKLSGLYKPITQSNKNANLQLWNNTSTSFPHMETLWQDCYVIQVAQRTRPNTPPHMHYDVVIIVKQNAVIVITIATMSIYITSYINKFDHLPT